MAFGSGWDALEYATLVTRIAADVEPFGIRVLGYGAVDQPRDGTKRGSTR